MSLFNELKRRNVFKVAIAYVIVSWLILQVIGSIVPIIEAPEWVSKAILIFLLAGFPIALLFAWAFELTPDGIKKESEVDRSESISSQTSGKINFIIIGSLVLIIGGFAYDKFFGSPAVSEPGQTEQTLSNLDKKVQDNQKSNNQTVEQELTLGIAVLPFENLSKDPNNAFFAGGVYEDVLTYLSRIVQWRVISRTSMEKIAQRGMEIRDIGKHLDVSHVLEGSVRRAGDRVRVTVQLINASNDEHIWAENYDRKLEDIFAIQTEIAEKIAQKLKTKLTPKQHQLITDKPTNNIEAYDLFIKARELARVWRGAEGFKEQIPLLEQAITLDPNFVEAKVLLVQSYGRIFWTGADVDDIYRPKAEALKNQILAEYPNSYYAYAAQGYYEYTIERNYQAALEQLQKALLERPDHNTLLSYIAASYKRLGLFEQSLVTNNKILTLDPESVSTTNELVMILIFTNKIDEAFAQAKRNLNNFPNSVQSQAILANLYFTYTGDVANYLTIHKNLLIKTKNPEPLYFRLKANNRNIGEIILELKQLQSGSDSVRDAFIDFQISELFNLNGNEKKSQQYATKTLQFLKNKVLSNSNFDKNPEARTRYATLMYVSCLANNRASFEQFQEKFHHTNILEIANKNQPQLLYALALAECGAINEAWEIIKNQLGKAFSGITEWVLVLDPLYQYYFSEIPEYKAMVKKLHKQKQLKNKTSKTVAPL
jgi:TolB-like protein